MTEPINVFQSAPSTPINLDAASQLLHGWVDIALHMPLMMPGSCPQCLMAVASITIGRGQPPWYRIAPCGCLFEVDRG